MGRGRNADRWIVIRLVMNGLQPTRVPDGVIAEIRARERDGLVELPLRLRRGDSVRILGGPFPRTSAAVGTGWPVALSVTDEV